MATETYFNDFGTTLNGAIDSTQTTLIVNNAAAFPNPFTGKQARIRIDDEILIVTAVNFGSSTFTVTRAAESTTGANHANGAQVVHLLTAGGLTTGISQNTPLIGTMTSLPGSYSTTGTTYFDSDAPFVNVWNGSSFTQYHIPIVTPPAAIGSWTAVNSGQQTASYTTAGLNITRASGSGITGLFVACPATPYKVAITFCFATATNDSNTWGGAYWSDGAPSPTKGTMAVVRGNGNWINYNITGTFTGTPSYTSVYDPGGPVAGMNGPRVHVILGDDGTNRSIYNSPDGVNYILGSGWPVVRTSNTTPTHIGFGIAGSTASTITLINWRVF